MNNPTKQAVIQLVQSDYGLPEKTKQELLATLEDDTAYDKLMHGATGASAAYIISKFLSLSKRAQVLLSIAGFGIGTYLLDSSKKRDKFLQYNDSLKLYEIKK